MPVNHPSHEELIRTLIQLTLTRHPPSLDGVMPNMLSSDQSKLLERKITRDEIKRAVWDCGGDRASGPNKFTFKFFTTFWDLLEEDVNRFVQDFFVSGSFPKGCNSSFIALIPKVSNATLVTDFRPISLTGCQYKIIGKILANKLSMVIRSCVSPVQSTFIKGRNILDDPPILSELDFEKAFDSLRWDFIDLVMEKLGFGLLWRSWIKGCLSNAHTSILVNGSPTTEFEISRGLRQGDPLSPFLFILAMEGLHAFICKAIDIGIYSGARIGDNNMSLSHLIYADDVIFLEPGGGVATIKRRRHDIHGDGVIDSATASGRGDLK
ncbi:putative RNA-directed DNA polymerase, eukaryota, reverse transcriptase zinc-binding domain protein [Tanacetum coccineum]